MTARTLLIRLSAATLLLGAACGSDPTDPSGPLTPPVAEVRVSPTNTEVVIGTPRALTVEVRDAAGRPIGNVPVQWAAVPATTATVSAAGVVTGLAEGEATVTATAGGKQGTAVVIVVSPPVASVELDVDAVALDEGAARQLTATPRDATGQPIAGRAIQWSSSEPGIALVTPLGEVMALRPGTATITARVHGMTASATVTVSASWSHDLLYSAWNGVAGVGSLLWVLDPRDPTLTTQPIRPAGLTGTEPAVSPDGRLVAFTIPSFLAQTNINVYDRITGQGRLLAGGPGAEMSPAWSPDGQWVAFIRRPNGQGGELYVVRADGTGATRVAGGVGENLMHPTWSPTTLPGGQRIAFVRSAGGVGHIFTIRPDGTGLQQVTTGDGFDNEPAWSPDGSTIAFWRAGLSSSLWLADAATGDTRLLIDLPLNQFAPAWSPDGQLIAFTSNHEAGVHEIYTVWTNGPKRLARRTFDGMEKTEPVWVRRP